MQYDPADNNTCSSINVPVNVQHGMEMYNPNGVCAAYFETIYIPPSNTPPLPFPPMVPPYVVQSTVESIIAGKLEQLPIWIEKRCYNVLKRYMCATAFIAPFQTSLQHILTDNMVPLADQLGLEAGMGYLGFNGTAMVNSPFWIPSYPGREVCTSYEMECAPFIEAVAPLYPQFVPNCAETTTGYMNWPNVDAQTMLVLPVPFAPGVVLDMNVKANTNNNIPAPNDQTYQTTCPHQFVVTPMMHDTRNVEVPGTGCSSKCITALFTDQEWDYYFSVLRKCAVISFIANIITLTVHIAFGDIRKEILIWMFIGFSLFMHMWHLIQLGKPVYERLCSTETEWIDYYDGPTTCAVESAVTLYSILAMALLLVFMPYNLFTLKLKNISEYAPEEDDKKVSRRKWMQIAATIIIPIFFLVAFLGYRMQGYAPNTFTCFIGGHTGKPGDYGDEYVFWIPVVILVVI